MILDAQGRERASREPAGNAGKIVACTDLDGDGRDELLLQGDDRLYACRGDLGELWSRPSRERVHQVIPAQAGRPATVVLGSMVALDGATGRPRLEGAIRRERSIQAARRQWPRVLTTDDDATICSLVLPTTPEGAYEPARGRRCRSDSPATTRAGSDRFPGRGRRRPDYSPCSSWAWAGSR